MKVIIIEDEKLSADYLKSLLYRIDPEIELIAVFDSVGESIMAFSQGIEADLVFVDIHLSDGISFDIFSKVDISIPMIFTTAFDSYAIKAFKLNSIDYLLKPIGSDELAKAIEKYKKWQKVDRTGLIDQLATTYYAESKQFKQRFMVKMGDVISTIHTDDISHFVSEDGVVLLVTRSGKRFIVDYILDQLEMALDPILFFRINRKAIVALNSIEKVNTFFNSRLKIKAEGLDDDASIVSRERVNQFKKWLDGELI